MVKRNLRASSKSGFSLIELMITVVVFSTGLVAILGSTVSMVRQQQYADYESLSAQWANLLLVELQDDIVREGIEAEEEGDNLDIDDVSNYVSGLVLDDGTPTSLFPPADPEVPDGNPVAFELDGLGAVATAQMILLTTGNPCEVQVTINVYPNGNTNGAIAVSYVTSRFVTY